jgi:hypothetical protein
MLHGKVSFGQSLALLLPTIFLLVCALLSQIKKRFFKADRCTLSMRDTGDGPSLPQFVATNWYIQKYGKPTGSFFDMKVTFLNRHTSNSIPIMSMFRDGLTKFTHSVIAADQDALVEWEGSNIIANFSEQAVGDKQTPIVILTLSAENSSVLKEFVDHATKEYYARNQKDPWSVCFRATKVPMSSQIDWTPIDVINPRTMNSVFLSEQIEDELLNDLETFKRHRDFILKQSLPYKRGYLFSGPPGSGKTSVIYAMSTLLDRSIYFLSLHHPEETFLRLIKGIPTGSLVVIEDVDTLQVTHQRQAEASQNPKGPELSLATILYALDGYDQLHDCIIVMTTNHPEKLDAALTRPGRADRHLIFGYATTHQVKKIVSTFFNEDVAQSWFVQNESVEGSTKEESMDVRILNAQLSTAELINTILLPHLEDAGAAFAVFKERLNHTGRQAEEDDQILRIKQAAAHSWKSSEKEDTLMVPFRIY